ncbi:hypothetical protein HDU96_009671 [Phlyctochytrium bullatum]|nr:hypothetical protein HDU96_009671 [Phlyctochytrium bullatum]
MLFLPAELTRSILLHANDLNAAIYIELLLAGFSRPFWIRINDDPASGPVRDAIELLLPDAWKDVNQRHFPASLALSQSLIVEPDEQIDSVPAFRLAWIAKFRQDLLTYRYTMQAAKAGRLDLIRLLDAFRVPKFCMATMDEAAGAGRLSVVKFLHFKRTEGCTSMAMTMAAEGGHMDVIRFLHANRTEGCQDSAITRAASGGHFEVISFLQTEYQLEPRHMPHNVPTSHIRHLHEKFRFFISQSTVLDVLSKGTPDELRYCLSQVQFVPPGGMACKQLGQLEVLMEFFRDDDRFWSHANLDYMAKYASLEMLEFLYDKRPERCTEAGLRNAAARGDPEIFRYLVRKDIESSYMLDNGVLYSAAGGGSVEILKLLAEFDHLRPHWTSSVTETACAKGRADAVRYLSGELGIPMKEIPFFSDIVVNGQLNPVLFALDEFGYHDPDSVWRDMMQRMFRGVCEVGTLEQVKHFSAKTPACPEAFCSATKAGRLDVLRFLLEHRFERPRLDSMRCALDKPIEFVQFFIEEAELDPALLLPYAVERGRLDIVRYLYDHLPPDTPLDSAIVDALASNHFEVAKFLHLKRPASDRLYAVVKRHTSMDVATFMVEHYAAQLGPSALHGELGTLFVYDFDIFKFLVEGGHLQSFPPMTEFRVPNINTTPDFLEYVFARGIYPPSPKLISEVVEGGNISSLRVLARANPQAFATLTHEFPASSLPALPFLSTLSPVIATPDILTTTIENCGAPVAHVSFLLDRFPDCFRAEHLAMAAKADTATALVLWRRAWKGGCPSAAMVEACRRRDGWLLRRFLEGLDEMDPEWRIALRECLAVVRKFKGNEELVKMIEEALPRTAAAPVVGGFDFGLGGLTLTPAKAEGSVAPSDWFSLTAAKTEAKVAPSK